MDENLCAVRQLVQQGAVRNVTMAAVRELSVQSSWLTLFFSQRIFYFIHWTTLWMTLSRKKLCKQQTIEFRQLMTISLSHIWQQFHPDAQWQPSFSFQSFKAVMPFFKVWWRNFFPQLEALHNQTKCRRAWNPQTALDKFGYSRNHCVKQPPGIC